MLSKQNLERLSRMAIKHGLNLGATQVEVVLWSGVEELTRFANNEIHQSVVLEDVTVHVRAIIGKKIGVARGNSAEEAQLLDIVAKAVEIARLQKADPGFKSLPRKAKYKNFDTVYKRAKHVGPIGRAKAILTVINLSKKSGLSASGAFVESGGATLITNSLGVRAFSQVKSANLSTIVTGKFGSGFAEQATIGGKDIDATDVAARAVEKATLAGEAIEVVAGEYEVILEPAAVAELLDYVAWFGPNGRSFHEKSSYFEGKMGKKLFDEKLTLIDDPQHGQIYPTGFDYEGFPKKPLPIVVKGRPKGIAYDSYHANKYHKKNTGHALLAPNTWGPVPMHIRIEPGDRELVQSIKGIKKGLLVTRFWYTRIVNTKELILTGMTRDGTFLIEHGKITARVKNLRYTESIIRAFSDIQGIGKKLVLSGSEGSSALVPHVHLAKFNFSSTAQHS